MSSRDGPKMKLFGQDPAILIAMKENIVSWVFSLLKCMFAFRVSAVSNILPGEPIFRPEVKVEDETTMELTKCVSIARPGGMDELRVLTLQEGVCTIGYNLPNLCPSPYTPFMTEDNLPADCVILKNEHFSVNYADVTIRWGLYESAKRFVGWPIVPGFDVAGVVEAKGRDVKNFNIGDEGVYHRLLAPCSNFGDMLFIDSISIFSVWMFTVWCI